MKKLLLLLFLTAAFAANSQTIIPGGNVYGTWSLEGSPYLVQGHIIVPDDSTLIIKPGVTVQFQDHYKFFCNGRIIAIGTAIDSIKFTASTWWGFRFDGTPITNDTSFFKYCDIQHGDANANSGNDSKGGAFFFNNFSKCVINHCYIANNIARMGGGAIYCISSSPMIVNSTFFNHTSYNGGDGIDCVQNSSPIITNNTIDRTGITFENSFLTITGNTITNSSSQGGIISFSATSIIKNNIIQFNSNTNGAGGGGILLYDGSSVISNNIISNNNTGYPGGGISCVNTNSTIISNNLIYQNSTGDEVAYTGNGGAGIFCSNSSPMIVSNTICDNHSITDGGGLHCKNNSNPFVQNTILYGNSASSGTGNEVYLSDNQSDPSFSYCNIMGGISAFNTNGNPYTGSFTNNLNSDPLFVNSLIGNYALQPASPCINTGDPAGNYQETDITGNPRINGSSIDIGAYEYQSAVSVEENKIQNRIMISPNPFITQTLLYSDHLLHNATLTMDNCLGETVIQIKNINEQSVILKRYNLASGLYFVQLTQDNQLIATIKLIITD
jgi:hypothetical protein